jgi:hypothetical protein
MFAGLSENLRIFCSSVLNLICLKLVYEVSVGFDSSLGEEDIQKFEKRPKVVPLFFFQSFIENPLVDM